MRVCLCVCNRAAVFVCMFVCVCAAISPTGDSGEELGSAVETEVFGDGMPLCQDQ